MRSLQNKPYVQAPDSDFPYGRIRDKTIALRGTKVNENSYGDFHQFFEKLMDDGGVTANELPDSEYSGFQLIEALQKFGSFNFSQDLFLSLIDNYTLNDVIILHGCIIDANIPGTSTITSGSIYYNGVIYKVGADSISTPSNTIVFDIDSSVQPNKAYIRNAVSGNGIADFEAVKSTKSEIYLNNTTFANYFSITNGTNVTTVTIDRAIILKTYNKIKIQVYGAFTGSSSTDHSFSLNTTVNDDFEMLNSGGSDINGLYRKVGSNGFNSPILIGLSTTAESKGIVQADSFTSSNQINVSMKYDTANTGSTFCFECEYVSSNSFYRPYQF